MKLPPIRLRRLYANEAKTGDFLIVAEPLPADVSRRMSDREHMMRRIAERVAIAHHWARITAVWPRELVDREELARRYPLKS